MALRFIVGVEGVSRSGMWKLWVQGDEVYLMSRVPGCTVKFSFHSSGICRWAEGRPRMDGRDRCHHRWRRNPIPGPGSSKACVLLSMVFPTNHLSSPHGDNPKLCWIAPAPTDKGTSLNIVLTGENEAVLAALAESAPWSVIYSKRLRSGALLALLREDVECGAVELTMPGKPRRSGQVFLEDIAFPDIDHTDSGRPIRLTVFGADRTPPQLFELGGYPVPSVARVE